jgi:ferredoxin-NADP reductase
MVDTAARSTSARLATIDTIVLESIVETRDTRTLVLEAGTAHHEWRAGQYVSIDPHQFVGLQSFTAYLEHVKGRREPPRAYSLSSAPHDPHLAITIKEEVFDRNTTKYPPLLSGLLVHHVRAGDPLTVTGFSGPYTLPDDVEARTSHVLHLCAGSGSVPDYSIIKDSLHRHAALRHTLVYSNKTWDDVIFRDDLTRLAREHPARVRVVHTLTRERPPAGLGREVRPGRVTAELVGSILAEEPDSLVYACGPAITVWERRACVAAGTTPAPRFLEAMLTILAELGVPKARITVEAYG